MPWTFLPQRPSDERLAETTGLVEALGCDLAFVRSEHLRKPNASFLLSGGLLDRLAENAVLHDVSLVVIDGVLTPIQQRNLEKRLGLKVIDRTGLILEIFGLRARTKEGLLQVELARLLYERSRLVRTWTHLERQRGGRGFLGGPGETQLEADKRMIDRKVQRLRRDLADVERTRLVQRAGRVRNEVPVVALVGYTNSGKSTLFNKLSGAGVLAKDMPFATLDPTIRHIQLPNLGAAVLVDTVGFITELPTHLIDSFRATLEETLSADLLIHVRDRASAADVSQKQDVLDILSQLGEKSEHPAPPIIEAWNKVDLLGDDAREDLDFIAAAQSDTVAVPISALAGTGIESLCLAIEQTLSDKQALLEVAMTPQDGALRAFLYKSFHVEAEDYLSDGTGRLSVRLSARELGRLYAQFPDVEISDETSTKSRSQF